MVSLLSHVLIDFLNTAKSLTDAKAKLFQLEQIQEILLFQEKDLIPTYASEVFDFMTDKSVPIRKFLIRFACSCFREHPESVVEHLVYLFSFLSNDLNDSVVSILAQELSKILPKVTITISKLATSDKNLQDVKQLWNNYKSLLFRLFDLLSSLRSDNLRSNILRLLQEQILFCLPVTTVISDPRLARKNDPRLNRASNNQTIAEGTAEEIPLHHPFVNRNELNREGEDLFSRILFWVSKGGPQNFPFSPSLLSTLGQVLASIAFLRPSCGLKAAQGLSILLSGKGSGSINSLSKSEREELARSIHRFLRSANVHTKDPEEQIQKLRTAVSLFEAFEDTDGLGVGHKRNYSEATGEDEEEGSPNEKRARIEEALKSAVDKKKKHLLHVESKGFDPSELELSRTVIVSEYTELSSELEQVQSFRSTTQIKTAAIGENPYQQSLRCLPSEIQDQTYSQLSYYTIGQVFENAFLIKSSIEIKAFKAFSRLLLNTILSLSTSEDASLKAVSIVNTWGADSPTELRAVIPTSVLIPRSLWLFISFVLQNSMVEQGSEQQFESSLDLLSNFCSLLLERAEFDVRDETESNKQENMNHLKLFEVASLAIASRLLQIPSLRGYTETFLMNLHQIPVQIVDLLIILMHSGSKSKEFGGKLTSNCKAEALQLLGKIVFSSDRNASEKVLNYMFSCVLSDDFELRSQVIFLLSREVYYVQDWCDESIMSFALSFIVTTFDSSLLRLWANHIDEESSVINLDTSDEEINFPSIYHSIKENIETNNLLEAAMRSKSFDENLRKVFHLLQQLCLTDPRFLIVLFEMFSFGKFIEGSSELQSAFKGAEILEKVQSEMKVVIPALLTRGEKDIILLEVICRVKVASCKPLLQQVLYLFNSDLHLPARNDVIEYLCKFLSITFVSDTLLEISDIPTEDFRLFLPVISGLSTATVTSILPRILKVYGEDAEELKTIFTRITKARPPPITKSALLVLLHRLNFEELEIKAKIVLDAIATCLNNKTEFSSDVIKEALLILLKDEIPSFALMRTAFLAGQSHTELKKLAMMEIIPAMIKKRVWVSAPKVWDGVLYGVKNFIAGYSKSVEPTLKALVTIPGSQLRILFKVAPNIKIHIANYYHQLPQEEKDNLFHAGDSSDLDRQKLLREVINSNVN